MGLEHTGGNGVVENMPGTRHKKQQVAYAPKLNMRTSGAHW